MKALYFLPLLGVSATGSAQPAPRPPAQEQQEIVITGRSLSQTERALKECLARKCPVDQDVDASLAHAENLFVAGNYQEARRIARASLGRNSGRAKGYPVPVSDLYRANARISSHLGEGADFERSSYGIRRALKSGLPGTDPRLIGADLEVAGMHAAMGRLPSARKAYEKAERDALEIERPDLAAVARVRGAWLYTLEGFPQIARKKLEEIAADRQPAANMARLTALVLLARMDRQDGKRESSDALIAQLRGAGFAKPVLLFSPPIALPDRAISAADGGSTTRLMAADSFEERWIDIGFWVTPEGRVNDIEVLRSKGTLDWTAPVLKSIAGRIYSPSPPDRTGGAYRVERLSYTARWTTVTGSRMRQRSPEARIEFLDLTEEDAPAPAPSASR
jgi:hypothetical protein